MATGATQNRPLCAARRTRYLGLLGVRLALAVALAYGALGVRPALAVVQPSYGGPGGVLLLQELSNTAAAAVTIREPSPGVLEIDLGLDASARPSLFTDTSSVSAPGLTYENADSPQTSNFATIDISAPNRISDLQARLGPDPLAVVEIENVAGGLHHVTATAATISVTGLDTSAANGNVALRAAGALTVNPNTVLDTGTGTILVAAGVNADDSASTNGG